MARLIYSINVTIDGCVDHRQGVADEEHHDYALELLKGAAAVVLGRTTYELFESHWPEVAKSGTGSPRVVEFARELDAKRKYVISHRRRTLNWPGSVLMAGNLAQEIREVKQQEHGDLVVFGSPSVARQLSELDEIDEYHFVVQPIVVGQGPTMFRGMSRRLKLTHLGTTVFHSGVVLNRFAKKSRG